MKVAAAVKEVDQVVPMEVESVAVIEVEHGSPAGALHACMCPSGASFRMRLSCQLSTVISTQPASAPGGTCIILFAARLTSVSAFISPSFGGHFSTCRAPRAVGATPLRSFPPADLRHLP